MMIIIIIIFNRCAKCLLPGNLYEITKNILNISIYHTRSQLWDVYISPLADVSGVRGQLAKSSTMCVASWRSLC